MSFFVCLACLVLTFWSVSAPVFAEGAQAIAHSATPSLLTYLLNSNLFNVLLVLSLLLWLAGKAKLQQQLQNQPKQISASLLEAEAALSSAMAQKAEHKSRLAQLSQVRLEELEKAERMATTVANTLKQKALAEQQRLKEAEKREKQRLSQLGTQVLLSSVADKVLAATRWRLERGLSPEQHRRVLEAAIAQLER
jgi:F0F1-type ATP synthase membrane subunit b/b'